MSNVKIYCSVIINLFFISLFLHYGCSNEQSFISPYSFIPREENFGVYSFDLNTEVVELIHTSASMISYLHLNNNGDKFLFSETYGNEGNEGEEIFKIDIDGDNLIRLTYNDFWDLYPCWSPDDERIAFLSWRENDLDIYIMNSNGANVVKFYDSGSHDADIDWWGDRIYFTSNSKIWSIKEDGTDLKQITNPPRAGEWGNANLPFGDYDPRVSPDGSQLVFERLVDDESPNGNYEIYIINLNNLTESALTNTGYSQGLAEWSHSGDRLVYIVAAIGTEGKYDIYIMNYDGSSNRNIIPSYFPDNFLCRSALFSADDSKIFFVGEWWE